MNTLKEIVNDHIAYRRQMVRLARADVKKANGGLLGMGWAILRPAIMIFVYWFTFTVGLRRGGDIEGYPFFLWLIAGIIPWYYMRDMISGGAGSIRRYSYLVTKIKYPVSTVPTFVSMGYLAVHGGLMVIVFALFMLFGYMPAIYWIQIPLYTLMMFLFFTSWGLFAGMLSAISRDFLNLVKSLVQALFWVSGILYDASTIEQEWIRNILLFNPVTIVINGYRNALVYHRWFWEDPQQLLNYAIVYGIMLFLSIWVYRRLKKDIPDVL